MVLGAGQFGAPNLNGTTAYLTLFASSGGAFNQPATIRTIPVGAMRLLYYDCHSLMLDAYFDAESSKGTAKFVF
jgi:hypothetical protein